MIDRTMTCRLFAAVLLSLCAGAAQAQPVRPGEISAELAAAPQLSYLGIDVSQLEASLCMLTPTTRDPKLVVANDGGNTGRSFGLDVTGATELAEGTLLSVDVVPASLHLIAPAALATRCGSWSYRATLDVGRIPAASTLTLVRSLASDLGGAFSGLVTFPVALELTPEGGGVPQWRLYTFSFNLAGTWGLAASGAGRGGSLLPATASNLVLFAQKSGPVWTQGAQPAAEQSVEDAHPGQLVLQATDAALAWLNQGTPGR